MEADRLTTLAKALLTIQVADGQSDLWLWHHSERVLRLARTIAALPELARIEMDQAALATACLFHDAGWIMQLRQGRIDRWQILARPTSDIQRELGASFLAEHAGHLVLGATLECAMEAIRQCNYRDTKLAEAQVLSEAENLDDVGALYVLKQIRQHLVEGRGVEQLLSVWARQRDYQYWEARIKDSFRFESVRQLARARLAALSRFMVVLAEEQATLDIRRLVDLAGEAETSPSGVARQ